VIVSTRTYRLDVAENGLVAELASPEGDLWLRLRPLGGSGSRKLQDVFVDARVPREDRDGWPLVFAGDKLAWVPGLAVDAELASRPGEPGLHVSVAPMPVPSAQKVVRLENPKSPRGDLS